MDWHGSTLRVGAMTVVWHRAISLKCVGWLCGGQVGGYVPHMPSGQPWAWPLILIYPSPLPSPLPTHPAARDPALALPLISPLLLCVPHAAWASRATREL